MTREQRNGDTRARRGFLKGSIGVGGGIAAASFVGTFGLGNTAATREDTTAIVHLATTAEALAVTFYYAAITRASFRIDEEDAKHLKAVMAAEMRHLQTLYTFGGTPLTQQFYLPERVLTDAHTFVDTSRKTEMG